MEINAEVIEEQLKKNNLNKKLSAKKHYLADKKVLMKKDIKVF